MMSQVVGNERRSDEHPETNDKNGSNSASASQRHRANKRYDLTGETGSYRYMAPEVFRHEPYSSKVNPRLSPSQAIKPCCHHLFTASDSADTLAPRCAHSSCRHISALSAGCDQCLLSCKTLVGGACALRGHPELRLGIKKRRIHTNSKSRILPSRAPTAEAFAST